MSDPPSYDQHLLDRLNALKKSSLQLDSAPKLNTLGASTVATPESDLSHRLRNLRNGTPTTPPAPRSTAVPLTFYYSADVDPPRSSQDLDDKTLEELLEELGPENQWTLDPDDPNDIQKLLNEAKAAIAEDATKLPSEQVSTQDSQPQEAGYLAKDLDMSVFALDDGKADGVYTESSSLENETREVQNIVAKLVDEVNLERQNEPDAERNASLDEPDTEFALPAVPTRLVDPPTVSKPETSKKSLDFESDIAARMAALRGLDSMNSLGLPSAPTFKPLDKPVKGIEKNYTAEDVDTWCVICQDDATVECHGCDGDLYCATCWKEGHMGPDVGWENKKHKWTNYRKPK